MGVSTPGQGAQLLSCTHEPAAEGEGLNTRAGRCTIRTGSARRRPGRGAGVEAGMRRLAVVSLGAAFLAAPVAARAGEPDPAEVARAIEEIRAHRAARWVG